MEERRNSIRQRIKQHPYAAGFCGLLVFVLFISLAYSFGWDWTGFNSGTNRMTITSTSKGNYTATISQPSKSLWDWLQLLGVLAIPAVVGLGAAWYTTQQGKASDAANKQQHETELLITTENQRETALQAYIDKISELLLKEHLGELPADGQLKSEYEQIRKIARVRTLTILPRLDAKRQKSVLLFLFESGLINKDKVIIDLRGADLSGVDLSGADLSGADLSEARLNEACLDRANLKGANLSETTLRGADLTGANLSEADLREVDLSEALVSEADLSRIPGTGTITRKRGVIGGSMAAYVRNGRLLWGDRIRTTSFGHHLRAYLGVANLRGANLYKAHLSRADLGSANLSGVDLSETDLRGVDLIGANLSGANLSEARLKGANLWRANLTGANLTGANLTSDPYINDQGFEVDDDLDNDLDGASLSDADLTKANLNGAKITEEQLKQAKSLKGATMPDGTEHP